MMNYQNSLFPDNKETFDADSFVSEQLSEGFQNWISSSVLGAFSDLQRVCEIQELTFRAKSDVLHDGVFAHIHKNAHQLQGDTKPVFHCDLSGNKKQYFVYNGYCYIIRKYGAGTNGTRIDSAILNQELPMHVITIEYTVSPLWDAVNTVAFKYIKGDGIELDYIIPTNLSTPRIIDGTTTTNPTETTATFTPKFKRDGKNKAQ